MELSAYAFETLRRDEEFIISRGHHRSPTDARQKELRMLLGAAIEELPAAYRAVILSRNVEGLSYQEIAEALGLTVRNIKTRVHRARLFLRKLDAHFSMTDGAGLASLR